MSDADETPEWWDEVICPPLNSKADAKRIIKLCLDGDPDPTWKPQWSTYATAEGRIRFADFNRAQAILLDASKPDPGRPGRHDWALIKKIVHEVAKTMPKPINKTAFRKQVSTIYRERHRLTLHPHSGSFKAKVRNWFNE
jgi:hypothetical protein